MSPMSDRCIACGSRHTNRWGVEPNMYCVDCEQRRERARGVVTHIGDFKGGSLFLSDLYGAKTFQYKHRICVHEMVPEYEGHFVHMPILNQAPNTKLDRTGARADVSAILRVCAEIDQRLPFGGQVLVHCRGGQERSPLVVAMYLVKNGARPTLESAYDFLQTLRPVVSRRLFWLPSQTSANAMTEAQTEEPLGPRQ